MSKGSTRGHAHVAPWKKDEVDRLAKLILDHPVVAVAEVSGIPAPQMQQMRASLRGQVAVVGSKNRLLAIAIEQAAKSRPGLEALADKLHGQSVILATKNNPFKLFKSLKAGASMAPLKGGQVAPHDIVIPKGGTPFGPGPIVGELQKVGIQAKIEAGKVVIAKESTPVKAGAVVSPELATMLAKLEIRPVELKIDRGFVHRAWADETVGAIFDMSVLLAKQLSMHIVAEGVEERQRTADQLHAEGAAGHGFEHVGSRRIGGNEPQAAQQRVARYRHRNDQGGPKSSRTRAPGIAGWPVGIGVRGFLHQLRTLDSCQRPGGSRP